MKSTAINDIQGKPTQDWKPTAINIDWQKHPLSRFNIYGITQGNIAILSYYLIPWTKHYCELILQPDTSLYFMHLGYTIQ